MTVVRKIKAIILILVCCSFEHLRSQNFIEPDTVTVHSGKLQLKGLLWRPSGPGLFPAIIFSHGSYETN